MINHGAIVADPEVEVARRLLAARRRRDRHLPTELLGEPCWDVLLDLLVCRHEGRSVPLNSACAASGLPSSTAMRWLVALVGEGLIDQLPDPHDRRRKLVALTATGETCVRSALREMASVLIVGPLPGDERPEFPGTVVGTPFAAEDAVGRRPDGR